MIHAVLAQRKSAPNACTAIDWTMPVLVGIGAQRKRSTPTGAADAEISRNALAMPHFSNQRAAGASDSNDSAHQGECERYSGRRPVRAEMRMAHCAVRIEDAHNSATNQTRPHPVRKKRKLPVERLAAKWSDDLACAFVLETQDESFNERDTPVLTNP